MKMYYTRGNAKIVLNKVSDTVFNIQNMLCMTRIEELNLFLEIIKEADIHKISLHSLKMHRVDMAKLGFIRRLDSLIRTPQNYALNSQLVKYIEFLSLDRNDNYVAVKYLSKASHIATLNTYGERLQLHECDNDISTKILSLPILSSL